MHGVGRSRGVLFESWQKRIRVEQLLYGSWAIKGKCVVILGCRIVLREESAFDERRHSHSERRHSTRGGCKIIVEDFLSGQDGQHLRFVSGWVKRDFGVEDGIERETIFAGSPVAASHKRRSDSSWRKRSEKSQQFYRRLAVEISRPHRDRKIAVLQGFHENRQTREHLLENLCSNFAGRKAPDVQSVGRIRGEASTFLEVPMIYSI